MDKVCKNCQATNTRKWYSGPICRQCYRKSLRLKKKESGIAEKPNKWRLLNKQYVAESHKKWKEENREYYLNWQKQYRERNKDKKRQWEKADRKSNLNRRLSDNLRNRLNIAIKNHAKSGSAVEDLGCSIEEFKSYLQSKFQPGMTWDNWSFTGWHIDHRTPMSSFNLSDRAELLKACHYTNLQPLWAKDNLSKGSKL
jgi:ribosomal protein L40E